MENKTAIKVQYGDDIRRFSLDNPSYDNLRAIIIEAFTELSSGFKLRYKDDEGGSYFR